MPNAGQAFTWTLAWRFLRARKLRTILAILSVALGAGLLVGLLTLNASMSKAVDAQAIKLYGDFDIMAGYRTPDTRFSHADLDKIDHLPGVQEAAPVLIPYMGEANAATRGLMYYGVPNTRVGRMFMNVASGTFPGPAEIAVSADWAKREGVKVGDSLPLAFGQRQETVRISGFLDVNKRVGIGIGVLNRTWLEEVTGRPGATFLMIDLQEGANRLNFAAMLQKEFPQIEVDQRKFVDEMKKNMNALRPVALGMGLAALLASAFLLTGAFRMSLAERTRELATLRAVAATPRQVRRLILIEGLLVGVTGSLVGLALGAGGAAAAAGGVARLLAVDPIPPVFPWTLLASTAAAGVAMALLSALGVARAASRTEPLRAMRPDLPAQDQDARKGGLLGLVLAIIGGVALAVGPFLPAGGDLDWLAPLLGSTGGLLVALGLLLGTQRVLPLVMPLLSLPFRRSTAGPIATRNILRHRRRSGLTVGALGLGMILVISISTMASSLVGRWVADTKKEHPADFQLEVPALMEKGVPKEIIQQVRQIPGVTDVGVIFDTAQGQLEHFDYSKADPKWLAAEDEFDVKWGYPAGFHSRDSFYLSTGDLPTLVKMGAYDLVAGQVENFGPGKIAIHQEDAVRRGIHLGDRLQINVNQGIIKEIMTNPQVMAFEVVAMIKPGSWRLPMRVVGEPIPGAADTVRTLYANASPAELGAARQQAMELVQAMQYNAAEYSDQESALAEMRGYLNQRLALLLAVAGIMTLVAVMSLINAMVSSVNDRKREFALLRSVGATPAQVRSVVLLEGGLLGLVGALIGVVGGAVLGASALHGLDMRWSSIELPWLVMAGGLVAGVVLALLASVGPARKVTNTAPAEAVRVE